MGPFNVCDLDSVESTVSESNLGRPVFSMGVGSRTLHKMRRSGRIEQLTPQTTAATTILPIRSKRADSNSQARPSQDCFPNEVLRELNNTGSANISLRRRGQQGRLS